MISRKQRLAHLTVAPPEDVRRAVAEIGLTLAADAAVVVLNDERVIAAPQGRVVYFPAPGANADANTEIFAAGEEAEFRRQDFDAALAAYGRLAHSRVAFVRAGALLRSARVWRTKRMPDQALAAYDALEAMARPACGNVRDTDGSPSCPRLDRKPADLVARHAACTLLAEIGRQLPLRERAKALEADLLLGRWRLTRSEWSFYLDDARAWLGPHQAELPAEARVAMAASNAMEHAWRSADADLGTTPSSAWVDYWREAGRTFVVVCSRHAGRTAMLVLDAHALVHEATASLSSTANSVVLGLAEPNGAPVVALPAGVSAMLTRLPADTGLPWTLTAAAIGPLPAARAPRTLLWTGIGALALLLTAGTFFIGRAITRELDVARMQSEFVSAVSHEFRTPLASVCHISEMLVDGRVADASRRTLLYETLHRESERLRRLVEGLLDFARMDAGGREYRFESVATSPFLRTIGDEFAADVAGSRAALDLDVPDDLPAVRVDREAVGRALWNLLDNAVKYSRDAPRVRLTARATSERIEIAVHDHGIGIAAEEQARIFQTFVRGTAAARSEVKGTGIGLSMVQHIVRAHSGAVLVESEPGQGSTFTIVLPIAVSARRESRGRG